jgi:tetratricopeptide (TPR) repeat protein
MKRTRRNAYCLAILALLMLGAPARNSAQEPSSKPTDAPPAPQPKPPAKPNKDSATQSAPDQPIWDPLRAEKDLEVGRYYMKKGDWDAAIDRFQDAILAKPGYAIPYLYLGEAQEKKGVRKQAIKSYTRYLDLYPHAEDADKIRKRIDRLWSEVGKGKKSAG